MISHLQFSTNCDINLQTVSFALHEGWQKRILFGWLSLLPPISEIDKKSSFEIKFAISSIRHHWNPKIISLKSNVYLPWRYEVCTANSSTMAVKALKRTVPLLVNKLECGNLEFLKNLEEQLKNTPKIFYDEYANQITIILNKFATRFSAFS